MAEIFTYDAMGKQAVEEASAGDIVRRRGGELSRLVLHLYRVRILFAVHSSMLL